MVAGVIGVQESFTTCGAIPSISQAGCRPKTAGGILTPTYRRLRGLYQFEGPELVKVKSNRQLTSYRLIARLSELPSNARVGN